MTKQNKYLENKGRSITSRFVKIEHYILNCEAYNSLSLGARSTYIEIKKRFNGQNNGYIHLSCREAAKALGCTPNTASKYIHDLLDKGFILIRQKGSFDQKLKYATEFILTEEPYNNNPPSKEFMKWVSKKK